MHVLRTVLPVPAGLPLGQRDDRVIPQVAANVGPARARERLTRVDQWCFDERGAAVACGSLQRAGPFPRDRVHDVRAGDRAAEMFDADKRRREQAVDGGTHATAARGNEDETRTLRADRDGPRRAATSVSRGTPGRGQAGRSPTSVTSWPSARSSRSRARANSSEPPIVERSFFAMTTRT